MLSDYFKAKNNDNIIFILLLIGAISTIAIYTFFSFKIYYFSDDIPLLIRASEFGLKTLLFPISAHLRPVMRIYFLILSKLSLYNYIINNLASLFLYIASLFSFYILLKEIYNEKTALLSTMFLTIISSYNEAVFWMAASGVLYIFLFFNLSFLFYIKKKRVLSSVFLVFAYFTYETWLLFIPAVIFYKIWKKEKFKEYLKDSLLILSFSLVLLQIIFIKIFKLNIMAYGGIKSISELPNRIMIYAVRSLSPFYTPSHLIVLILFFLTIIFLIYYVIKSGFDFKITFPITLYFGVALIFLLSSHIASRFYMFPVASLSVFISLTLGKLLSKHNKHTKIISYSFVIYLIIVSSVSLYIDGLDYKGISDIYRLFIYTGKKNLSLIKQNDYVAIINKVDDKLLEKYVLNNIVKEGKIFYYRGRESLGGFIKLNDYVDFILAKKGFISKRIECKGIKKVIKIGRESRVYSVYCFKIVNKK